MGEQKQKQWESERKQRFTNCHGKKKKNIKSTTKMLSTHAKILLKAVFA